MITTSSQVVFNNFLYRLANFRKFKENLIKAHPELQKPEKVQIGEDFMMEEAMQFVVYN